MKCASIVSLALLSASVFAADEPQELLAAMIKRPWPGENYPALPSLSSALSGRITEEMSRRPAVLDAFKRLEPNRSNHDWFDAVATLQREKAVWALQACLCHPSEDVQIHALRSLRALADRSAVPFLLVYAEHMAVYEGGSETATIHGMIHTTLSETLYALTGVSVVIKGQNPEALKKAIRQWTLWQANQPN